MADDIKKILLKKAENDLRIYRNSQNDEERKNHRNRYWETMFELEPYYRIVKGRRVSPQSKEGDYFHDKFSDLIIEMIDKYDPDEGSFENYFNRAWAKRQNDIYKKDKLQIVSIDAAETEDDVSYADKIVDEVDGVPKNQREESNALLTYDSAIILIDIYRLLIEYEERYKQDKRKEATLIWNKLMFTEMITDIIKNVIRDYKLPAHETQVFKCIKQDFLDHYMSDICDSLRDILLIELKKNREFGIEDREDDELSLPLHTLVWISFLFNSKDFDYTSENTVRASLSANRKRFSDLIKGSGYSEAWGLGT